ncbi:MAG TPA: hypothetical protein VEA78_02220 [Acidimicrobiales bacterium]|nr:hypothetical protein [Acidimicrobiales bacterium]
MYWAADCFASLLPGEATEADDVPYELWEGTFLHFSSLISPWLAYVDQAKYEAAIDRVERLDATAVVGGHMAALRGERLAKSFELLRRVPQMDAAVEPGQADLDAMLALALTPA